MVTYPQTIFLSNTLSPLVLFPSRSSLSSFSYSLPLFTVFSLLLLLWDLGCEVEQDEHLGSERSNSSIRDHLATNTPLCLLFPAIALLPTKG